MKIYQSGSMIDNPLRGCSIRRLKEQARDFAKKIGADEALFERAVQIAKDPPSWRKVGGLTKAENTALGTETSGRNDVGLAGRCNRSRGFWSQPRPLRLTVVTLCFSAIVQGFVQSVTNGTNQTMPEYFNLKYDKPDNHEWVSKKALYQFSILNAVTYLVAGLFGCWLSDPLQSGRLGRRGAILLSACICFAAAIGSAFSTHWWVLLIWRAIMGIGLGSKAPVTPIFGAEIAPSHLRGTLVMNWQLFDAFGIFCGFTANLIFYDMGTSAWKYQSASAALPAGILLILVWNIPESPRWLLKKGRAADAFSALCEIRPTPLQAATELLYANAQIQTELQYFTNVVSDPEIQVQEEPRELQLLSSERYQKEVEKTGYLQRISRLFSRRIRRSTLAASVCMIGQQLCGVNVLAFYSIYFLQNLNGHTTRQIDALWLSWGIGLANFLFTFPAYWGIDRLGRRSLLLLTYPGMIICLLGSCMSFLGGSDHERTIRVGVFIFFFILFYSLGQGPVAFTYASEVFPLFNREAGMGFAVCTNLFPAGLLTLFVPLFQVTTTFSSGSTIPETPEQRDRKWLNRQAGLLGLFTGLCTLSYILIFLLVPETKLAAARRDDTGQVVINYISLEELNHIFNVPTKLLVRYHITQVVPYVYNTVRYHLSLGEERPILKVMYYWAELEEPASSRETASSQSGPDAHPHGTTSSSQHQRQQGDDHIASNPLPLGA